MVTRESPGRSRGSTTGRGHPNGRFMGESAICRTKAHRGSSTAKHTWRKSRIWSDAAHVNAVWNSKLPMTEHFHRNHRLRIANRIMLALQLLLVTLFIIALPPITPAET